MTDLYANLSALLKERKITGYRMCVDLGLSKNLMTELKTGRKKKVSTDTAQKLAEYFGISVDELLGQEEREKPATDSGDELNEYLEELKTRPECRMLFQLAKGATREEVEAAVRIIEALRNKPE